MLCFRVISIAFLLQKQKRTFGINDNTGEYPIFLYMKGIFIIFFIKYPRNHVFLQNINPNY